MCNMRSIAKIKLGISKIEELFVQLILQYPKIMGAFYQIYDQKNPQNEKS